MKLIQTTLFKLTTVYLGIIMVICLFFSAELYRFSTNELEQSYRRQSEIIQQDMPRLRALLVDPDFLASRNDELASGKQRIFMQLVYVNLLLMAVAGVVSYLLARRTLRPIQEAHDAQSRFTADASHELRTPLAAMQTEIEVALRDPDLNKKHAVELLNSNLEELAKLRTLSDELLRLARLQDSRDLPKRAVALADVQAEAIQRVLPLAERKHILIVQSGKPGARVLGDAASLTEMLVILLDNAIKYSPERTQIELTTTVQARSATLTVRDQGIGIKASDLPHIFERFYRADSSRNKQTGVSGYGLGLSIAKRIIDLHGGRISVASEPGKGTAFTAVLPRAGTR